VGGGGFCAVKLPGTYSHEKGERFSGKGEQLFQCKNGNGSLLKGGRGEFGTSGKTGRGRMCESTSCAVTKLGGNRQRFASEWFKIGREENKGNRFKNTIRTAETGRKVHHPPGSSSNRLAEAAEKERWPVSLFRKRLAGQRRSALT